MEKRSLSKLKVFRLLFVGVGCLLFFFSMNSPFYHYRLTTFSIPARPYYSIYYWSFKIKGEKYDSFVDYENPPQKPILLIQSTNYWFYEGGFL